MCSFKEKGNSKLEESALDVSPVCLAVSRGSKRCHCTARSQAALHEPNTLKHD